MSHPRKYLRQMSGTVLSIAVMSMSDRGIHVDQIAKPTFRSRYAHTPFGSAPVPIILS